MTGDKEINIKFIDSKEQRYSTCGDYWETPTSYEFRITKQDNPDKNLLILVHEMIEYILCTKKGITEQVITDFDLEWNKKADISNDWYKDGIADEPGNEPTAPYYKEHRTAENFERLLAEYMDIDWFSYDRNLIL